MDWNAIVWDSARAGGLVAYVLVTVSVVLGLVLSNGWKAEGWPRFISNGLHEHSTSLALVFTAVHGAALSIDPYMRFSLGELLVPLASRYRPAWVAVGIVTAYLMAAIWISGKLRPLLGYSWWRRLHYVTILIFAGATLHGITTGTDSHSAWAFWLYGGSLIAVTVLLANRILTATATPTPA